LDILESTKIVVIDGIPSDKSPKAQRSMKFQHIPKEKILKNA
jgi:hypothetical protein